MMRWAVPLLAFVVGSCGAESVQSHNFSLKVDTPFVPGVNKVVGVRVDIGGDGRDAGLLIATAKAIKAMAADLNNGKSPVNGPFDRIYFTVYAPQVERTSSVNGKLIHLTYDRQELQRTVRIGVDEDTLLASASDVGWWTPANDDVIDSYCLQQVQSAFCAKIASPQSISQ